MALQLGQFAQGRLEPYFQISPSLRVPNVIDKDLDFLRAVAVRAGPVTTTVPEPQTLALVLLALWAMTPLRRMAVTLKAGRCSPHPQGS